MKANNYIKTQLNRVPTEKGESIEEQLRRMTAEKQPVPQEVEEIFTPLADGVVPDYDIRYDRFDAAIEASDKFSASKTARAAEIGEYEPKEEKDNEQKTE